MEPVLYHKTAFRSKLNFVSYIGDFLPMHNSIGLAAWCNSLGLPDFLRKLLNLSLNP